MMLLSEAARVLDGHLLGADVRFGRVGTDSRASEPGELFVALRGERFDGHGFVAEAAARGAVAALVDKPLDQPLTQLQVGDTLTALGELAANWRRRFDIPLVAITGSNGKTTVKEMVAAILAQTAPVLATRGNLNNQVGLPLTLLRLRQHHAWAVIEAGMSAPGELAGLGRIAAPTVAVITNAAAAHLAGLGDVAAVARAKAELLDGLCPGGTAILNLDDPHIVLWRAQAGGHPVISFSLEKPADFTARYQLESSGTDLTIITPAGEITTSLALLGRHNVANALAAAAAATSAGASLEAVVAGLAAVKPVKGRLSPCGGRAGARLIDDSYNANPASLQAALDLLALLPGRRTLVMGDMAELGAQAPELHRAAGRAARIAGIEQLWGCGPLSCLAAEEFGPGGQGFSDRSELLKNLPRELGPDDCLLVKGSRSAGMEQVVAALACADNGGAV
ncbi:MAG: UDP-N-acetylmuramoyl-tripeptide--D-alanyl-D-alanine ligase [Gammaproteobacteria bacterium]|nr:UDP-N-acetylmuramoyl-tripeptide--D-alanyl-D-alanine ligase [Gammaproteobacteria bacterium]